MSKWSTASDKELWILSMGEYRIPHICTPGTIDGVKGVIWMVTLQTFLGSIFSTVDKTVKPLAFLVTPEGNLIADETFRAHFTKAPGITPEFYVKTATHDGTKRVSFEIDRALFDEAVTAKVDTKFIDWLAAKTDVADQAQLRLIWLLISQHMPQYLLEKHSPIDFGWARLFALPYRNNWKQILHAKFPRIWLWLKNPKEHHKLEIAPFSIESRKADMLAIKSNAGGFVIAWHPEFQANKLWYDYSYEVEKKVFATGSQRAYLVRIGHLFNRHWPYLVSILRSYVEHTNLPCGDIGNASNKLAQKLVAFKPEGKVSPVPMENPPVRIVGDDCDDGLYPTSIRMCTKGEGAYVQEVPFIPLDMDPGESERDMRESRRNLR